MEVVNAKGDCKSLPSCAMRQNSYKRPEDVASAVAWNLPPGMGEPVLRYRLIVCALKIQVLKILPKDP